MSSEATPTTSNEANPTDNEEKTESKEVETANREEETATEKKESPFEELGLNAPVLKALDEVGYETPSPIQSKTIPLVLSGRDVLGQAQTGTGKTAAFALPLLTRLDLKRKDLQVLVLAPTRELAIQVAEAFQRYACHMKGFHVLPVYGGTDYGTQLRQLKRGVHVVVGTPGRVMDHMRRGTLKMENLDTLVLDEADEMLRMGFIDDVEWILEQTPDTRQIALFSATMPKEVRRIAKRHLKEPAEVTIEVKTRTAETINQRYWLVSGLHKLDALTRILEAETFDGMILFVRTKTATVELSEKLQARGFAASPLNGDINQNLRERTVDRLKEGKIDILVATDVAARGLDVDRISHVVNYDIPYDTEAYVHRIGRTGRAGRSGEAILFVAPREQRMLRTIERATGQKVTEMRLPTVDKINDQRISRFKERITSTIESEDLGFYLRLMTQYQEENEKEPLEVAAALARLVQGNEPFLLSEPVRKPRERKERGRRDSRPVKPVEQGMDRYRIEVGHQDGVAPGNIVGAIANESGIESRFIGRINIYDDHSTIDLPEGMPKKVLNHLRRVYVSGRKLDISPLTGEKRKSRYKGHTGSAAGDFKKKKKAPKSKKTRTLRGKKA